MAELHRWPVDRKGAVRRTVDADSRRLGRTKILPRVVRAPECVPTKSEYSPGALQLFALRQASPQLRATRIRAVCYSTTPAIARLLLPAHLLQAARSLGQFRWKCPRGRPGRAGPSNISGLCLLRGSCVRQ